jgi:acyl-CoA thioesterase-2
LTEIDELLTSLNLLQIGPTRFEGTHPPGRATRVFGGQILAQGLRAAALTVDGRLPHSLHLYFLRPAHTHRPLSFEVEVIRDGRSFSARQVTVSQDNQRLSTILLLFSAPGTNPYPASRQGTPISPPESLLSVPERLAAYSHEHDGWWVRRRPIELRPVGLTPREALDAENLKIGEAGKKAWLRADGTLPTDPILHACVLAYASDMTLLEPLLVHRKTNPLGPGTIASLDHALWFHQIPNINEWHLYEKAVTGEVATGGICSGRFYTRDGVLVASTRQEGYLTQTQR